MSWILASALQVAFGCGLLTDFSDNPLFLLCLSSVLKEGVEESLDTGLAQISKLQFLLVLSMMASNISFRLQQFFKLLLEQPIGLNSVM